VNMQTFMAGAIRFDTFALRVRDFIDAYSRDALWNWYLQVCNPISGQMGLPKNYKKDLTLIMFAPDGSAEREWKVEGAFPQAHSWGEFSYTTVENVVIELTMRCDRGYLLGTPSTGLVT